MDFKTRLSVQRESLKLGDTQIVCENHLNEPITNFCFTSLRALCPACVDAHNKMMKQNGMFPEIDTLGNVKADCTRKCQEAIDVLNSEIENLDNQPIIEPQGVIEDGIAKIRESRDKMIAFINNYADEMEAEYERAVNDAVSKAHSYNSEIGGKTQNMIQELENLMYNIETPNCIPSIKKICLLDFNTLLDKFKTEINHTYTTRENISISFPDIMVNEPQFPNVTGTIQKYISLSRKEGAQTPSQRSMFLDQYSLAGNIEDDPGFQRFHKESRPDTLDEFPITLSDYFEPGCKRKYLHFFQNHENRFHFIDISNLSKNSKPTFQTVELNMSLRIPPFHKSIMLPNGEIYLVGGSDSDDTNRKLGTTFLFDWKKYTLIPKAPLKVPRSSFGICYLNKSIYVAGGLTNNSTFTRKCERYDLASNRWVTIADANFDVMAPCLAAFNNKYIFKFGGYNQETFIEPLIERYDPTRNCWTSCNVKVNLPTHIRPEYFKILSTSAALQINRNEIYVFGGYLEDNTSSNQTFTFKINQEDDDSLSQSYTISKIGIKSLTHPEAFWNNTPIILNKRVFALQNVQTIGQEDVCLDDKRRLICFDSRDWFYLA